MIMDPQIMLRGVATRLKANTWTKDGYDFIGWSENSAAVSPTYTDRQEVTFNSNKTLYAIWQEKTLAFDATPMISSGCWSTTFGPSGTGGVDKSNPLWNMNPLAEEYLSKKYNNGNGFFGIRQYGGGIDHLMFTHVPGKKNRWHININATVKGLGGINGYDDDDMNFNGSPVLQIFFVGQEWEVRHDGGNATGYINGNGPTQLVNWQRHWAGHSNEEGELLTNPGTECCFTLMNATQLRAAKNHPTNISLTINGRSITGGQMREDWLDAWVFIDHLGSFPSASAFKVECRNCTITWE